MDKIDYQGRNDALVKAIVMVGDLVLCNLLFCLSCHFGEQTGQSLLQSCLLISAVYFGCTVRGGVILHKRTKLRKYQIISVVLRNTFYFTVAATVLLAWGGFARPTAGYYTVYLVAMFAAISCFRLLLRWLLKQYWMRIRHRNGVVFVGSTENNVALYNEMAGDPSIGYHVCGYFDTVPNEHFPKECPYLGTPENVIPYLEEHRETVRSLYCCLPSRMKDEILPIIKYCENHIVRFYSVPNVRNYLYHKVHFSMMGSVPCLSLHEEPLGWIENRILKRGFDIVFSLCFLCTLFIPILIIVSIITKITMPGPVFFRQKRNGLNGKEFC